MTAEYTARNRAIKQETGTNLNVWGTVLNQQATDIFDEALDGRAAIDLADATTLDLSSATYTKNGESDTSRRRWLVFTNSNSAGTAITIPSVEKWYFVRNSGSYPITLAPSGGSVATVAAGQDAFVLSDGTNCTSFRARLNELAAPNGNVAMGNNKLTGLANGTDAGDAVNKGQLDIVSLLAQQWATKTDGFVSGSDNSAKSWAVGGTGDGDPVAGSAKEWATSTSTVDGGLKGSRGYANDASTSADLAEDWATSTGVVSGGLKGARGYAQDADASAQAAADSETNAGTSETNAGLTLADFEDKYVNNAGAGVFPSTGNFSGRLAWSGSAFGVYDGSNYVTITGVPAASTTVAGIIRIATQAEAEAASLNSVALTPSNFGDYRGTLRYGESRAYNVGDLNDLIIPGFYQVGPSQSNAPTAGQFYVMVQRYSVLVDTYVVQRAYQLQGGEQTQWVRTKVAGTWQAWRQLACMQEVIVSASASGSAFTITSGVTGRRRIIAHLIGVSLSGGGAICLQVSSDGGSNWYPSTATNAQLTGTLTAANTYDYTLTLDISPDGLSGGYFASLGANAAVTAPNMSGSQNPNAPSGNFRLSSAINAIRFVPSTAVTFDAGTITVTGS